jgi:hypothetical protein
LNLSVDLPGSLSRIEFDAVHPDGRIHSIKIRRILPGNFRGNASLTGKITGMMNKVRQSIRIIPVAISLALGFLLAWLLKDDLTPLITGGISFTVRSLPVQILLLAIYTVTFGIVVLGIAIGNDAVTDKTVIKPAAFLAIIGGLIGASIFFRIYGPGTLDPGRVDWLFNLGDNAQHYLGWVFYRNDPWTWPVGFSCSLGYPTGTCMCFTDSIPLLAIPFKIISPLLPATFQYFGLWTLLCFILQGAFAALILYEVTGSRLTAVIAPLFFCTADILLFRVFRYTPLTGQWIVLFALYLYFLNKRISRWNGLWPLVHIVAVLIQGYFFVMTFVVFCGTLLERYLADRKLMPIIKSMAISLISSVLCMWIVGFFTASVDMSDVGLGYFKANLNAFYNPLNGWSRFFPALPLAEGTYAMNVNYLGFGIILLAVIGLAGLVYRNRKAFTCAFCNNWGLVLIIPILVIFALSNVVTLNDRVLFAYNLPEPLMRLWGVFRGTERMLWPVYYLVFVFAISQATRLNARKWVTGALLLAAFGIQWMEVAPQLQRFHTEFDQPQGKTTTLESNFWADAAGQYNSLVILPLSLDNWARLTEYAAEYRMKINYSYYARYSPTLEPAAQAKMDELIMGKTRQGEMYILKSPELLHQVCNVFDRPGDFLGFVNGEWVLGPGFNKQSAEYDDVSTTGGKANCENLSLPDFLAKYQNKLVILAAKEDVSSLRNDTVSVALKSAGLEQGLPTSSGSSYIGMAMRGKLVYENQAESKIEFSGQKGDKIYGATLPVNLQLTSAGRISGEEDAVIQVNGRDYSYHQNGLNVVVIDPDNGEILDTALYPVDTK